MDTPAKRIQWALEQRGMGVRELARRLGVSPGLPSQWWRTGGRATSPDSHLDQISEILDVNVDWLRYGRGEPFRSLVRRQQELGATLDTNCARIIGIVEGEVWREGISMREAMAAADSGAMTLQVVSREDLQGLEQFAVEVRGHVCDRRSLRGVLRSTSTTISRVRPARSKATSSLLKNAEVEKSRPLLRDCITSMVRGSFITNLTTRAGSRKSRFAFPDDRKRDVNDSLAIDLVGHVRSFVSQDPRPRFGSETAPARSASRFRRALIASAYRPRHDDGRQHCAHHGSSVPARRRAVLSVCCFLLSRRDCCDWSQVREHSRHRKLLAISRDRRHRSRSSPTFTLTIDNPVSMRSLIAFVCVAMTISLILRPKSHGRVQRH